MKLCNDLIKTRLMRHPNTSSGNTTSNCNAQHSALRKSVEWQDYEVSITLADSTENTMI